MTSLQEHILKISAVCMAKIVDNYDKHVDIRFSIIFTNFPKVFHKLFEKRIPIY